MHVSAGGNNGSTDSPPRSEDKNNTDLGGQDLSRDSKHHDKRTHNQNAQLDNTGAPPFNLPTVPPHSAKHSSTYSSTILRQNHQHRRGDALITVSPLSVEHQSTFFPSSKDDKINHLFFAKQPPPDEFCSEIIRSSLAHPCFMG